MTGRSTSDLYHARMRILAVVGSLRHNSVNAATARAAATRAPTGVAIEILDVSDIPLYNGDIEADGGPLAVVAMQHRVAAADGIVFFTPEYNSSLPAVVKNVIDWLSRPPRSYEGTAVTAIATTPGRRAGAGVLAHFTQIMEHQPTRLFGETLGIGSYTGKLDADGELVDPATLEELHDFLERFADFAATDAGG